MKKWLSGPESGQTMMEYVLIIALVAMAITLGIIAFRDKLEGVFNKVGNYRQENRILA